MALVLHSGVLPLRNRRIELMPTISELAVEDYMTPQATVIDEGATLTTAIQLMDQNNLTVLPVVNRDQQVVGVISASDLLEITREIQADLSALSEANEQTHDFLINLLQEQRTNTTVKDVMSSPAVTVSKDLSMVGAAKNMLSNHFHHFPVVDGRGKPVGVISTSDFLRAFAACADF
jgi:CBS domain-containing protein